MWVGLGWGAEGVQAWKKCYMENGSLMKIAQIPLKGERIYLFIYLYVLW